MKRKGQQSVELLMTYGWAILIIIVVIGALWKMGVFDETPETTSEEICQAKCESKDYHFLRYHFLNDLNNDRIKVCWCAKCSFSGCDEVWFFEN